MRTDWQKLMPLLPLVAVLPILQELQKLEGDLAEEVCWAMRCYILQKASIEFSYPQQKGVYKNVISIYERYK